MIYLRLDFDYGHHLVLPRWNRCPDARTLLDFK